MREIIIMYSLKMLQILIVTSITFLMGATGATDKVFCYYESWDPLYPPSEIDTDICTHVNYAVFKLQSDGNIVPTNTMIPYVIKTLQELKVKSPKLKVSFSVGGEAKIFAGVAANSTKTTQMAKNALAYLELYKLDGVDVMWKYPSSADDKKNFVLMLETLHKELKSNKNFLLTTSVGAYANNTTYNAEQISELVDYVNVMAYDTKTAKGSGSQKHMIPTNCHESILSWKKAGVATCKLVLGLAFFGNSFKRQNNTGEDRQSLDVPVDTLVGQLPYHEICQMKLGWKEVWDYQQKIQYKYGKNMWIVYENPSSIGLKVKHAKDEKLAGVMVWTVNQDDASEACGVKNALLKAVKKNLETK